MSRSFSVRPAIAADLRSILELLEEGLGAPATRKRTEAFWRWKHVEQPFGESIVLVAESGSRLVGLRAFMRWRFHGPGGDGEPGTWSAVRAVDTVTHPGHRRRGVFAALNRSALAAARDDGVDFVFNTPNAASARGYLKQGWQEAGALPLYLRPVHPLDLARAGIRYLRRSDRVAARQWRPEGLEPVTAEDAAALADASGDEPGRDPGLLRTDAGPDFYRWRYCRHPHVEYYRGAVGRSSGPFVVRPNVRLGVRELVVCRLPRVEPRGQELRAAVRRLRATGASYWVGHGHRRHPHRRLLSACGFRRVPAAGPRLLVRALSERAGRLGLADVTRWAFEMGDLEVF